MKTKWDYSDLAQAYLKRPDYSDHALANMFETMQLAEGAMACDMGAGVAHLTLKLAQKGYQVRAVEPNDNMRELGRKRTAELKNVQWFEGTGEESGQVANTFDLVSFGSSFNVTDRQLAMKETARILKRQGWFACMWNHRDLSDPIQSQIEAIIQKYISAYDYGSRREDQTDVIEKSGIFKAIQFTEGKIQHQQTIADCLTAWKSHGTLHRQAGDSFESIIEEIEIFLKNLEQAVIQIPYTTRIWFAQKI